MDANKEVKEVESAAMAVEADAEAQARGSAEVEAEMRRGGEQVRELCPRPPSPGQRHRGAGGARGSRQAPDQPRRFQGNQEK